MTLARAPRLVLWLAAAAGIALAGVVEATLFYDVSPLIGIAVPIGLAVAGLVLMRPEIGIWLALIAVPGEALQQRISPMEGLLLLSAAGIVLSWLIGSIKPRIDPVFFVYAAGLVWIAAGIGIARDTFIVERTLLMWSAFGLVALYVSNSSPAGLRRMLYAIVAGAAMTAAMAVATGSTQESEAGATAVTGRASGSFTHPNQLAFFLVMALPVGLVLAARSRGLLRFAVSAGTAMMFAALLLTLTRGAIIGAAVSVLVMLTWAQFRRAAAVVLVGLAIFAVLNSGALSRSQELNLVSARLGTVLNSDSATVNNNRLEIWKTIPTIVSDHPVFGFAVGNFKQYSLEYGLSEGGGPFEHAHNITLTVVAEQGIPGLLLYLVLLVLAVRLMAQALRRRSSRDFPYALAPIAGLTGLFVNGLTDYPPGSNPNMALIMVEIGVLVAATRHLREADERRSPASAALNAA